jgi:surface antigen
MSLRFAPLFGVLALALAILVPAPASAQYWQCVTYARTITPVEIRGNANTWWGQAEGRYQRGQTPREGAVMAFRSSRAMPLGHVAVVSKIISDREVLLDHANWSVGGRVEHDVRAVDVSDAGDWSAVKVWFGPIGDMGKRVNAVAGFIYPDAAPQPPLHFAKADVKRSPLLSSDVIRLAALELASGS